MQFVCKRLRARYGDAIATVAILYCFGQEVCTCKLVTMSMMRSINKVEQLLACTLFTKPVHLAGMDTVSSVLKLV